MKYLQRLLLLLSVSCAIFSCQKEYSVENSVGLNGSTAQWSFKEGSAEFKGPVDTVTIDALSNYQLLTINGHSTDKKDQIILQVYGTSLKAGTYKTPYNLFAYSRNGVVIYQTNPTAVDSFTIVLTKFDSTGVSGTFSGKAYDSTKAYKSIVDGKFSAVLKTSTTVIPSTDSGNVVLWSKAGCGGGTSTNPINVTVSNKSGQITKFITTEPTTCDPTGTYSLKLPVGTYPWVAKCGTDSVAGTLTVTKGGCTKVQVDFTAPVVTGDYFPMTKNSNWSYLYEGGTAADTLYTFSTGTTKPFLGNTYSLFTNTDGVIKDSSYYRKSGNTYYEYVPAAKTTDSNIVFTIPAFEYSFLVDNLAANATFLNGPVNASATTSGVTVPVGIYINSTILATGASATIGTKTYTNVIKVKNIYSYKVGTTTTAYYAIEQWFSKGIGLIKYIDYSNAPTFTMPDNILNITGRYQVAP